MRLARRTRRGFKELIYRLCRVSKSKIKVRDSRMRYPTFQNLRVLRASYSLSRIRRGTRDLSAPVSSV
jgi:hypothetical protein